MGEGERRAGAAMTDGDRHEEMSLSPAGRRPRSTLVGVTQSPITRRNMTGIRKLHSKGCPGREGGRCRCGGGYEASVFSKRDNKKIRKTFAREAEAKSWRRDALAALDKGAMRAPKPTTIKQAWASWYEGAKAGVIRTRSGDHFKPSALRSYERAMRLRVLPEFGANRLSDLTLPEVQAYVRELQAEGLNASTIKCTLLPLRALCKAAIQRGELAADPCSGVELPAVRGRRDRVADPAEAAKLIAALPESDRALWATATYAGLRRGELRALREKSIDLGAGVIRVERSWDRKAGEIAPKSAAGCRRVPIPTALRDYLTEHRMSSGRDGSDLAFGRTATEPFAPNSVQERADRAWSEAGLDRITLHECRHTFASLMIASGVNVNALKVFMGHANISTTLDRYGHLLPGSEAEAAGLLDGYLVAQQRQAEERAREADPVHESCLTGEQTGERIAS
jgi:integrase